MKTAPGEPRRAADEQLNIILQGFVIQIDVKEVTTLVGVAEQRVLDYALHQPMSRIFYI